MATADVLFDETEEQRIERWRCDELERAGYDRGSAAQLARRSDVDLHVAIQLLEHGCAPELALKILL